MTSSSNYSSNDGTARNNSYECISLAIQAMTCGLTFKSISINGCILISDPLKCVLMILRRAASLTLFSLLSRNNDERSLGNERSLYSPQIFSRVWLELNVFRMLEVLHNM